MSAPAETRAAKQSPLMTGAEKVAVLLLALGKARAAKLLKRFDGDDLKLLSRSVSDLRPISSGELSRWSKSSARNLPAASTFSAPPRRSKASFPAS